MDPYFGVWTKDEFKTENLSEGALGEFFRFGEEYVDTVLGIVRERIDRNFQPSRAFDFGCGVGRLTIPLARICPHVVGADVSHNMLNEARKNLRNNVITNVDLVTSDDELANVSGMFDLVVSSNVLQHIPARRGEAILKAMIDRLDAGGVGVLDFTYFRSAPRSKYAVQWMRKHVPLANNFVNLLQNKPFFYPLMQWNNYDLNNIFLMLQEKGCEHSYVRFRGPDHYGHHWITIFFQKKTLRPVGAGT